MNRAPALSRLLLRAALASSSCSGLAAAACSEATPAAFVALKSVLGFQARSFTTSLAQQDAPSVSAATTALSTEPPRKYRSLADKELWHEAWMYEDKFGAEDDPIVVPSLESERIIGVTDPEDETLVVWGILRDGEGPRQFVEGGEYYVLKLVPYIKKVGDALEELDATKKTPLPK